MVGVWKEVGYDDFSDGIFGNGGQNIYVSRNGVLQRIFRFDINRDGYVDVLFANSQDMGERPPVYVYTDPVHSQQRIELPTAGAYCGAIGDLNDDGFDDLVVANQHNGTHSDVTAFIYYGSRDGYSERFKVELPVPNCRAVAIGDFNGDGKLDIAFSSEGKLVVYYQTERGFHCSASVVIDLEITHMTAGDIDGDGYADLYVRVLNGGPLVLWGGAGGLRLDRMTPVGAEDIASEQLASTTAGWMTFVEGWMPKIVKMKSSIYLYRQENGLAYFYPVSNGRSFFNPLIIDCADTVSAAVYDINANGHEDIVLVVCQDRNETEQSWIYWGSADGFDQRYRTMLPTVSARDVCIVDLDGDSHAEIIVCQGRTDVMNTTESLIFKGVSAERDAPEPIRLPTHDATAVLVGRNPNALLPQLLFINHVTGRVRGDIPSFAYLGGKDGFRADRRIEFPGWAAADSICCDFNDNGWGDLLLANTSENAVHLDPGSFLYWGGADGFHQDRMQIIPTLRAHGIAVGDFRRCGYLDVMFAGVNNPELVIFQGGPNGFDLDDPQRLIMDPALDRYVPVKAFDTDDGGVGLPYREPRWLLSADFNNDGWLDIYVSQVYGFSFILWGGPDGYSMERISWLGVSGGICAQAADLTGNGWLDLVVGGHLAPGKNMPYESYVYIYWGGPDGYSEERRMQLPAHTANSIAIADFNNDGVLDIFITSYNSGRERDLDAYIYWGQAGGLYSAERCTRLFAHSSCGCIAADFNEDGWIDIAVANHKTYGDHNGSSFIWWNGPDGFSEQRVTELPTNGPHGMIAVDPGNVLDRGSEEYYISSPCELPAGTSVTGFGWEAEIQPKTWVRGQLRFAQSQAALEEAEWQGPAGKATWFDGASVIDIKETEMRQTGQWIQYRLALGAVNGGNSPRVTEVKVEYEGE